MTKMQAVNYAGQLRKIRDTGRTDLEQANVYSFGDHEYGVEIKRTSNQEVIDDVCEIRGLIYFMKQRLSA